MFEIFIVISLIVTAIIDLKTKTIPPIIPLFVLALAPLNLMWSMQSSLIGVVILGGALLIPSLFGKTAFGGGDIKLVCALAYTLGYETALLGLFIAVTISLIPCIYLHIAKMQNSIAFAPFIAIGFIGAIILLV